MADIVVSADNVGIVYNNAELYNFEGASGVTITPAQAVYFDSTGKLVLSNAGAAGTAKFAGIVTGTIGRGISICRRGVIAGFTVTGLAVGAKLYLSDTAGKIADAAGTVSKVVGAVIVLDGKKVPFFEADWLSML
jgi:hypothetical protein